MKDLKPDIRSVSTKREKMLCAEMITGSEPWITLGVSYDQTMDSLNDPLHEVFAAYIKEEMVGVIIVQTKGAFSGYIKSLVIKAGWRNKHLGKIMMEFIEDKLFAKSSNIFLCVSSFNMDAQKFYLELGYQVIGVLKNYLVEGYDEILMRKTTGPILGKTC